MLSCEEHDATLFAMLDEGPGLIAERLTPFFCPDCRYKIINGHEFRLLCESLMADLPDGYNMPKILLGKNVRSCVAMIQKSLLTGKSAPNGKVIKSICKNIVTWLPEEPVAIRVEEQGSRCEHPNAFKVDRELHGAG